MKAHRLLGIAGLLSAVLGISIVRGETLIYSNAQYAGYAFAPGANYEIFDYGTSPGGLVSSFVIAYLSPTTSTTNVRVRFYRHVNVFDYRIGVLVKQITIDALPATGQGVRDYEYVLSPEERFELPSGTFGYSITWANSTAQVALASGGAGNQNELWEYFNDWIWGWGWYGFWFGGTPWAGLYMQVYTAPPLEETTCAIEGYVFHDLNANGIWDEGEPALPNWQAYLDLNQDGQYQPSEPNVPADPNGLFRFEYLEAPDTYTLGLIVPDGWSQTTPGLADGYQYTINADPNNTYGPFYFGVVQGPLIETADLSDFVSLSHYWLRTDCNAGNQYCRGADLNRSGAVDFADLLLFCERWLLMPLKE